MESNLTERHSRANMRITFLLFLCVMSCLLHAMSRRHPSADCSRNVSIVVNVVDNLLLAFFERQSSGKLGPDIFQISSLKTP